MMRSIPYSRWILILPLIPLLFISMMSLREVRLKIGDYYLKRRIYDQSTNWYKKAFRKEKLKINFGSSNYLNYAEILSKLKYVPIHEKEERHLKICQLLPFDQLTDVNLKSAFKNLSMGLDFSKIVIEGSNTYIVDWIGQKARVEGLASYQAEEPFEGTRSLMVEGLTGLTKIFGPPSALDLNEGSLAVWARLIHPKKTYSALVSVNDHSQIYIYHRGADGKFCLVYNNLPVDTGTTLATVTDSNWHHYTFTWKDSEQKFYIDSREVFSGKTPSSTDKTTTYYIAWVGTNDTEQWHGPIANFLTFDRALNANEVTAIYKFRGF